MRDAGSGMWDVECGMLGPGCFSRYIFVNYLGIVLIKHVYEGTLERAVFKKGIRLRN